MPIRDFADPDFPQGPNHTQRRGSFFIISIVLFLMLAVTCGLFAFSPWFYLKNVRIQGLEFVPESDVQTFIEGKLQGRTYGFLPMRHRMFIDLSLIQKGLESSFAFSSVRVGKSGNTLSVDVRERPSGIFVTDGKHPVFADLDGIVVRAAVDSEKELVGKSGTSLPFLLLFVESEITSQPGDRLFQSGFLQNYQSLQLHFEVETGLAVYQYILPRPNASWMKIRLADKRDVYVDMTRDIGPQIDKLMALLRTKGQELVGVTYIDLRYTDRVYYK